jgi:hypothetical protein
VRSLGCFFQPIGHQTGTFGARFEQLTYRNDNEVTWITSRMTRRRRNWRKRMELQFSGNYAAITFDALQWRLNAFLSLDRRPFGRITPIASLPQVWTDPSNRDWRAVGRGRAAASCAGGTDTALTKAFTLDATDQTRGSISYALKS